MTRHILLPGLLLVTLGGLAEAQVRPLQQPLLGVESPLAATSASADAFFDDSVLHEIRLEVNERDWASLKDHYLTNTYYPADFRWGTEVVRNVGIRSRGTSSRSGVKPGLRVDFDRYSSDQTFRGLKSFVLRNNATDASNIHDRLSMLFFRRMGLPASREAQARLYVNGVYAGLYSAVESVDKSFLSRNFGDRDGYLYKFDRNAGDAPYHLEYRGPDAAAYVPHPFKPETHEADPQPEPIAEIVDMVAHLGDDVFRPAIEGYLDLAGFVKQAAIESFLVETDGILGDFGMNNFFLYRPAGQRRHVIIPWDKSEVARNATRSITHGIDDVADAARNRLMARAWAYPDLKNLYLDTLLACAASAIEAGPDDEHGWMEREIEREFDQIKDAVPDDPDKPYTQAQFIDAINDLRRFAHERPGFVTSEVRRTRPEP